MNTRTIFLLGVLCSAPNASLAQTAVEPPTEPAAVVSPLPRTSLATRLPRVASAPAAPRIEMLPAAPGIAQAPAAPKPAPMPAGILAPAPPVLPRAPGQLLNVRVEVILSDTKGSIKTLTMTVADGESAMNRTSTPAGEFTFNADAAPNVVGSKIRLKLSADANVPGDGEKGYKLSLRQSQTVILSDGESVEISRAADPTTDRAFVLSVKASIQR